MDFDYLPVYPAIWAIDKDSYINDLLIAPW